MGTCTRARALCTGRLLIRALAGGSRLGWLYEIKADRGYRDKVPAGGGCWGIWENKVMMLRFAEFRPILSLPLPSERCQPRGVEQGTVTKGPRGLGEEWAGAAPISLSWERKP